MYPPECYICHNIGHVSRNCIYAYAPNHGQVNFTRAYASTYKQGLPMQNEAEYGYYEEPTKSYKQVWKMKEKQKVEDQSLIVQTALKAQDSPALWILDSGCSGHMTGDKNKFSELQEYDGGSVKFGNKANAHLYY